MNTRIEKKTADILKEAEINELPIPIEAIALKMGLRVMPYDLGENVSGVLVISEGQGIIGYNPSEAKVRQRFTIAHELGHYELHRGQKDLFIDKKFIVEFRNRRSSTGEIKKEQEANAFAAAILMPDKLLLKEIKNHNYDLNDEDSMRDLARIFNVSISAITFRIANLNLFKQS